MQRLAVIALLVTAGSAEAQGVFRGPYLNDVTGDAITVLWESPAASTGTVRYRSVGAAQWQTMQSGAAARHQEVRLTGLTPPGGEIEYELDTGGTVYPGRFRTAPAAGAPFGFVVYGDNRSSPDQHRVVVDALLREMPGLHFAINTGDMVSSGQSESDWDAFFPVAAPFLASMPFYVAIGNHEASLGNNISVTRRIFALPTGGTPAANDETYYRFLYGNVEMIIVNVEVDSLYTLALLAGAQEDWLKEVLAQPLAGAQHRFVFLHQGPYSSKQGRNGNFWLRQWLDDFKTAGIDVVFSGHDHYAERGFTEQGLYYVIHGGGGAPLYNTLGPRSTNDHTIMYGETRLGYAIVKIDGPKATVEIKGIGGELVDTFTYGDAAAPECSQPADCGAAPRFGCPGGGWECRRSACQYSCAAGSGSMVSCVTDSACTRQIGANCAGTVSCVHPSINPLSWYCNCELPPDCTMTSDCANRPTPIAGCTGTWACVDSQCEFTTNLCTPQQDAGPSDAALADDAAATPASDAAVASPMDAATLPDAAAVVSVADAAAVVSGADAAVVVSPDAAEAIAPVSEGCHCGSTARGDALWVLGALALFMVRRRR